MPSSPIAANRSRASRALGVLALITGVAVLSVLLYQFWWTDVEAGRRSTTLVAQAREQFDQQVSSPGPELTQSAAAIGEDAPPGAIVHLPTIDEVHPVGEGVEADVLDLGGLGRYPGSASPGTIGNYAVAGHRTTYGRPLWALDQLTPGDPVVVETAEAYHVYTFRRHRVVTPEDTTVLAPAPDQPDVPATEASMVLTTCHPVFSARQRLIGNAVLDRSVDRSAGPPPELGTTGAAG